LLVTQLKTFGSALLNAFFAAFGSALCLAFCQAFLKTSGIGVLVGFAAYGIDFIDAGQNQCGIAHVAH
jgi:hypothetical protein